MKHNIRNNSGNELGQLTGQLVEGPDVAAGHELVGQVRLAHLGGAEHEDGVPVSAGRDIS